MQKRAPTLGNILVIILFALSCFGLLLFLWESFGGPLPLKPKGYRMTVAFPRTLALAEQSDVRISGVDVGHVIAVKKGQEGRTIATIEIASKYAPIRANMHAILRQKTLLGETYVQLIPEGQQRPLPGRQRAPAEQPGRTVGDARRHPHGVRPEDARGLPDLAAVRRRRASTGAANRSTPTSRASNRSSNTPTSWSAILASQEGAVRALVHNTGVVFNALASRDHQLEGLIVNGEHTFHAAAEASQAFADAFRVLPAFERNSRMALKELDAFAEDRQPVPRRIPDAGAPAVRAAARRRSRSRRSSTSFLTSLGPLTKAAKTGLPDLGKSLNLTVPVLENLRPVLHNLDPFLQYTGDLRAARCRRSSRTSRRPRSSRRPTATCPNRNAPSSTCSRRWRR